MYYTMRSAAFIFVATACCVMGRAVTHSADAPRKEHHHHHHSHDPCRLDSICSKPLACPIMRERPPPKYGVEIKTNVGSFTIQVETKWAPNFATRFWQLSRLRYMDGARFYRVASHDFSTNTVKKPPFVIQFGYMGTPRIDNCWDEFLTSNETAPVVSPGNQRGYVSFSMEAVTEKTNQTPYCQYPENATYCALGFSTNIFINLGDNSRLDAPGFSIFGKISDRDMKVVDKIYRWYGEVKDLCPVDSTDSYCRGYGFENKGVFLKRFLLPIIGGNKYLKQKFPELSYIKDIEIVRNRWSLKID